MTGGRVWVNGMEDGRVDPADRGLTLGDGVFDTLVAFNGVPFAGERHRERLRAHAGVVGIRIAPGRIEADWAACLAACGPEPTILRTTLTRGPSGRGLWPEAVGEPTLIVAASPWSPALAGRPARLVTGPFTRNPASLSARLKTIGYLDNILAARRAARSGVDDALVLNVAGRVACTTIANIFVLWDDRLATPPTSDGALSGIVRGLVFEAARAAGLAVAEEPIEPAALRDADAVFLTNSVRFIRPVLAVDGVDLPQRDDGRVRGLATALSARVRGECGFDPGLAVG